MKITFAQQAQKFLLESANRKRNPLRPASLRTYRAQIETHLIPLIGKKSLQDVGNKVVSEVVQKLVEKGLSPSSITLNVVIIKKIRKSAVNSEGDQLFPATWNTDVIDAPVAGKLKQPTVSAQQVQDAISEARKSDRPECAGLYLILASTGLRIAEALALKFGQDDGVSTVWVQSESKIIVRQQKTKTGVATTKTEAGQREIDLVPELNDQFKDQKPEEVIFPDSESYYREHLKLDGIEGGFHAFRRFRVTHLRLNGVPEALVKYWTGHAAGNITERYTQVAGEIESRKKHAAQAGLGFQLPKTE